MEENKKRESVDSALETSNDQVVLEKNTEEISGNNLEVEDEKNYDVSEQVPLEEISNETEFTTIVVKNVQKRVGVYKPLLFFLIVLIISLGVLLSVVQPTQPAQNSSEHNKTKQKENIRTSYGDIETLTQDLDALLATYPKNQQENISIYLRYPNKNAVYAYNIDKKYMFTSMHDVLYAMYIYDLQKKGDVNFSETITIKEKDQVTSQKGILLNEGVGSKYRVDELLQTMVKFSDDTARSMLIRTFFNSEYTYKTELKSYMPEANYYEFLSSERDCSGWLQQLATNKKKYGELYQLLYHKPLEFRSQDMLSQGLKLKTSYYSYTGIEQDTKREVVFVQGRQPMEISLSTQGLSDVEQNKLSLQVGTIIANAQK